MPPAGGGGDRTVTNPRRQWRFSPTFLGLMRWRTKDAPNCAMRCRLAALYKELTDVESGFRQLKDVMAMRPIYHRVESRVKAHIFVAALALLVQRLLGRRLQEAGVDLSPARAMQALSTVRLVRFRFDEQPARRGVSGGCPDARRVLKALKLVELRPPEPP